MPREHGTKAGFVVQGSNQDQEKLKHIKSTKWSACSIYVCIHTDYQNLNHKKSKNHMLHKAPLLVVWHIWLERIKKTVYFPATWITETLNSEESREPKMVTPWEERRRCVSCDHCSWVVQKEVNIPDRWRTLWSETHLRNQLWFPELVSWWRR